METYRCPCCENLTLSRQSPGSNKICPICGWEDDGIQFLQTDVADGPNQISLNEAKRRYAEGKMVRDYTVIDNIITVNDHVVEFLYPIRTTRVSDDNIIVLLKIPCDSEETDNLYCINRKGEIVWRSQPLAELYPRDWIGPYVGLSVKNGEIMASDFSGGCYFIDPNNGRILKREFHRFC